MELVVRDMKLLEMPARWGCDPETEYRVCRPYRLLPRRYLNYWWRTYAAVSFLFWLLFGWFYLEFVAR